MAGMGLAGGVGIGAEVFGDSVTDAYRLLKSRLTNSMMI